MSEQRTVVLLLVPNFFFFLRKAKKLMQARYLPPGYVIQEGASLPMSDFSPGLALHTGHDPQASR